MISKTKSILATGLAALAVAGSGVAAATPASAAPTPTHAVRGVPDGCQQFIEPMRVNASRRFATVDINSGCNHYARTVHSQSWTIQRCLSPAVGNSTGCLRWTPPMISPTSKGVVPIAGYDRANRIIFSLAGSGGTIPIQYGYRVNAGFGYFQKPVPPLRQLILTTKGSRTQILRGR